jgi:hypothetical protein
LRIEILKMKQLFSEKCDNYREGRHKLQKKVKKRDDKILDLEQRLGNLERALMMRDAESRANVLPSYRASELQNNQMACEEWQPVNGEVASTTGKFGVDLESSQNFALKSNVSSRSLENTRNFNSTAKMNMRAAIVGLVGQNN